LQCYDILKIACKPLEQLNIEGFILSKTWTVQEILDWTRNYLMGAGVEKSRLEAEELLAHTLDVDRLSLYLNPNRPLNQEELDEFRPLIKKRKSGEPLQYITGKTSFMGITLKIDQRALIPRPETEELTEEILSQYRDRSNLNVLDLGTGSGAIAIALAKFLVNPEVTAIDKSEAALELARQNASVNDVEDTIYFEESHWFSKVTGRYEIIVSNPPYIPSSEIENLDSKIRDHEPLDAIDGGEDGMREISKIVNQAPDFLADDGTLFLEISYDQGNKTVELVDNSGLKQVSLVQDINDKDRIICGRKKG